MNSPPFIHMPIDLMHEPAVDAPTLLEDLIHTAKRLVLRRLAATGRWIELMRDADTEVYGGTSFDSSVSLLQRAIVEHDYLVALRCMGTIATNPPAETGGHPTVNTDNIQTGDPADEWWTPTSYEGFGYPS